MSSAPSWRDNREGAGELINEAAGTGAGLIVLPENFCLMPEHDAQRSSIAEDFGAGPIQEFLSQQARRHAVWLIAGTVPLRADAGRVFAACLMYDPKGQCVARYDKIHLFDVTVSDAESYRESATIAPGAPEQRVVVQLPEAKIGLSVCYDLRFPEFYRALISAGAEILAVPSAFTAVTGRAHWETLLRARAIENQVFVLAAGQWGRHANGRDTYGDSMIVGPWGDVLKRKPRGTGIIDAHLDLDGLRALRRRFPCLEHRRL